MLPARGTGLIIASDTDPEVPHYGRLTVPPRSAFDAPNGWKYWNAGSCSAAFAGTASPGAGCPDIEILWFRVNGTTFVATAKIAPKATHGDRNAMDAIVRSLR